MDIIVLPKQEYILDKSHAIPLDMGVLVYRRVTEEPLKLYIFKSELVYIKRFDVHPICIGLNTEKGNVLTLYESGAIFCTADVLIYICPRPTVVLTKGVMLTLNTLLTVETR